MKVMSDKNLNLHPKVEILQYKVVVLYSPQKQDSELVKIYIRVCPCQN